jgi:uncharacterized protein DUF5674
MDGIQLVTTSISVSDLAEIASHQFLDMVKAVVDVEKRVMAVGGELHADEEALLLEQGSLQRHLWGINLYPEHDGDDFVEFDSMINLRPSQGNRSRGVDDPDIREAIVAIVHELVRS